MWEPAQTGRANSPGLPLGEHSDVFPMRTTGSGSSTPCRSSPASQTPGSSRFAVAYRSFKQWVEGLLVSGLNPTVTHVSKATPRKTTSSPSGCIPAASAKAKRNGKNVTSEPSHSCCSVTPLSRSHSPEVGTPPIAPPGSLSESSRHYSNGINYQTAPASLSPRWPLCGTHPAEGHQDCSADPSLPQGPLANFAQEGKQSFKLDHIPEDALESQHLTVTNSAHCHSVQSEDRGSRDATSSQHASVAPDNSTNPTADTRCTLEGTNSRNQTNTLGFAGLKVGNETFRRPNGTETPRAGVRAPTLRTNFLHYTSFRVRWGDVKTEPSPDAQLPASSLCESATECDIPCSAEPRDFLLRRDAQAGDSEAPALEVSVSGTEAPGGLSSGYTKTHGLQDADSLLWRMKDRLSSTFWSKTSAESRTHISREQPRDSVRALSAADTKFYGQESFAQGPDPHFQRHLALVFKDPEIESAYGEFLRKARVKRLVLVGLLTIFLNTMYDMPEWIITFTAPMLRSREATGDAAELVAFSTVSNQPGTGGPANFLTWFLVSLDVVEVLCQVVLAASGYLPVLKHHTERTAVAIMLGTSLLSSIRPAAVLFESNPQRAEKTYRETLVTPVQTIMTSTFLRSIVGSVLIDLVCLVRRRKLFHFHKLLLLLLLALLVACTVGGLQLHFPYSFFVFSWTVGLATGVVIASCYAGAYMSELMHRKAFYSVSTISAKLERIQEENKSQRATGKNMLEQLVGFLEQMGASLSSIDPGGVEKPVRETLLLVSALQAKCLGVLTSGRDMYAVNWLSPEVPPETQLLYKKFIEPYVRQDSVFVRTHEAQVVPAPNLPQERSNRNSCTPTAAARAATLPQPQPSHGEAQGQVAAVFQPLTVTLEEGFNLPEVDSACLTSNWSIGYARGELSDNAVKSLPENPLKTLSSKRAQGPALNIPNPQVVASSTEIGVNRNGTGIHGGNPDHDSMGTPASHAQQHIRTAGETDWRAEADCEVEITPQHRTGEAALLWGGHSAETESAIEEALKSPIVSGTACNIGAEWTIDMFALDQLTDGNCLVLVGLQLLLPHVRNGGLSCTALALHAFLKSLQDQYLPNLYHNRLHGAMVAHLSVMLARMSGLSKMVQLRLGNPTEVVLTTAPSNFTFTRGSTTSGKQWQPRDGKLLLPSNSFHAYAETQATAWKGLDEEVVICVAALGHDVGHPGLNNAFLVSTNQSLALVYNDNAVLENYHAYITFRTISATAEVDGGILRGLSASAYRQLRKQVIDLILATDMAQHFPILSSFRARNASQTFSVSSNEEDKWMLAKLLIKTGDIGHSMLAWEQHYMWACRVNEEFYKQGDLEEKLGIAISPLCDRRKADELPQAQCSFLEYIVLPLATEIRSCLERQVAPQHSGGPMMEPNCTALYLMEGVISHANYNLRCWKSMTSPPSPQRQENTTSFEPLAMAEKDNEAPCHNDRKGTPTVITTD